MSHDPHDPHMDDEALNRFADGELPGPSSEVVRSHLRSCAACREEVEFIGRLTTAIRTLPTPRPPGGLLEDLFGEEQNDTQVFSFPVLQGTRPRSSRLRRLSLVVCGAVVLTVVSLMTIGSDRALAGSSLLRLERSDTGSLSLRYETVSALAGEPSLRARIRYWIPDSLRFVQTEPGFRAIELSGEAAGSFEGVVDLPPGTVYAVVSVEDLDGSYIDSSSGWFWEYLEADAEGRPTLQARRYQLLATPELNVTRTPLLAARAASEFPGQPEFWFWLLSFELDRLPPASADSLLSAHAARLTVLDGAARRGNPGPVEIDALSRYARNLERTDLEDYWRDELIARYPRHGSSALMSLQAIVLSPRSSKDKLEALEEQWAISGDAATAKLGLRYSFEFTDPDLTEKWLDRHQASSADRSLSDGIELAREMMEVPPLWPIAERWVLQLLPESRDWVGSERPLDQSRHNFEAERRQNRARLNLYLSRIRLARGDVAGAIDALEQSVEETWSPEVFATAAELLHAAGSNLRAAHLAALARVDPVTPLEPHFSQGNDWAGDTPTDVQLAAARVTMRERITQGLLDEHVDPNARLRSETGDEITLGAAARADGSVTLILQTIQPDLVPGEVFALLDAHSKQLSSAGVRTLYVAQQPDTAPDALESTAQFFYRDANAEVWDALRAWRTVQYFVLDRDGRLRYRGEEPETALRISFVLSM